MNNVVVSETAEVFALNNSTGKVFFCGLTTKAGITQKVKQDMIKGGIGNGLIAVIQSEKDIEFDVATAIHNDELYGIQSGAEFATGTYSVYKTEIVDMTVATDTGTCTVTGSPKAGTITVVDCKGVKSTGTCTTHTVTVAKPSSGTLTAGKATVTYQEDITNASILDLRKDQFPQGHTVQLHSIAYDPKTNVVVQDMYWTFPNAISDGAINSSYEAGKNVGDTVKFKALADDSGSLGKYVVVPRA